MLLVIALALIAVLRVDPLGAQAVAFRPFPKPTRELDDPFSMITAIIELKPGVVAVADFIETEISVVDFATGSRKVLGRKGAGPGEYTAPGALMRIAGDTLWVLDMQGQTAGRLVSFTPTLAPGSTSVVMLLDQKDTTVVQGPMFADLRGRMYAFGAKIRVGGANVAVSDSMDIVRFDPRTGGFTERTVLGRARTPKAGDQKREQAGNAIKITAPFGGLAISDGFAAFADGRVAIVRGGRYGVEFVMPDGRKTPFSPIAYDRIPLTEADKKAEMDAVRTQLVDGLRVLKRMLPPNITLDIDVTPPPQWPAEYPANQPLAVIAAPDGRTWIRRSTPARLEVERWDVVDQAGKLVARWELPKKTSLVALGQGVAYTVRIDEDDLRYVQTVSLPR